VGMIAFRVIVAGLDANVELVPAPRMVALIHFAHILCVITAGVFLAVVVPPAGVVAAAAMVLTVKGTLIVLVIALGVVAPVVIPVVVVLVLANAKVAEATDIAANRGGAGRRFHRHRAVQRALVAATVRDRH